MSNGTLHYSLNGETGNNLDHAMDDVFLKNVTSHIRFYLKEYQFKKVEKRKKLAQAAYAIAKKFGHRSSFHDLYLWHPTIAPLLGHDDHIPIPGVTTCSLSFRLVVLGRQSQDGSEGGRGMLNKVSLPNQIEIDTTIMRGQRSVRVSMELTAPALRHLLVHMNWQQSAITPFMDKIEHKWGSTGVAYGTYKTGKNGTEEEYAVFRLFNGVQKVMTKGAGMINGHVNGQTRGGFMGQSW